MTIKSTLENLNHSLQNVASEDCTECENKEEFTRIRRKKLRLELINYPISLTVVGRIKPALFLLGDQIFFSNVENFGKPMKKELDWPL